MVHALDILITKFVTESSYERISDFETNKIIAKK